MPHTLKNWCVASTVRVTLSHTFPCALSGARTMVLLGEACWVGSLAPSAVKEAESKIDCLVAGHLLGYLPLLTCDYTVGLPADLGPSTTGETRSFTTACTCGLAWLPHSWYPHTSPRTKQILAIRKIRIMKWLLDISVVFFKNSTMWSCLHFKEMLVMLMIVDSFFFFLTFLTYTVSASSLPKFIFKYMGSRNSRFREILKCGTLCVEFFEPRFSGLQVGDNNSYNLIGL